MNATLYAGLEETLTALIDEFGGTATLDNLVDPAVTIKILFTNNTSFNKDGGRIEVGAKTALIAGDTTIAPAADMVITHNGEPLTIQNANPIAPDGITVIFYEVLMA